MPRTEQKRARARLEASIRRALVSCAGHVNRAEAELVLKYFLRAQLWRAKVENLDDFSSRIPRSMRLKHRAIVWSRKLPKREWPDGPWQKEPDHVRWAHRGMACLIMRSPMGALCGYVGVPKRHPLYGVDASTLDSRFRVHGGITWAADDGTIWWIGFDCGHWFDTQPGLVADLQRAGLPLPDLFAEGTYRTIDYVRENVEALADQIIAETEEARKALN